MSVRSTIAKALGVPISEGEIQASLESAGMTSTHPFSPGEPIRPFHGYSTTPRAHDFPTGYNIAARPRLHEQVNFSTLRGMVNAYDIASICIWHRIDSIRSLKWNLQPPRGAIGDYSTELERGYGALRLPDRETPFKSWLAKYLFDVLAYDAGTLYKIRNGAGRPIGLRVLDGTLIAPLLDDWGNRPTGQSPAFVQFAQGIPWEWLTSDDLIYTPFRPQSNSPYGRSPLETILLNANTDLRFQTYFLQRFTEGNVPEGFAGAPEGWGPDQIKAYQAAWDALLYGDDTQKHQIKWVPFGTKFDWTNERPFEDTFSLFLMRKTAAAYHVTPSDLGFTEDVNKSSGDTQADVQFRVGDLPLIQHVEEMLSKFLQDDMSLPLEFHFDVGQEVEDRLMTAQADEIYIRNAVVSGSEVRERVYGLPEPDGMPMPRYVFSERAGPIPLSAIQAVAGPLDPVSGAPLPGAPLPHKPFAPVEGVAPQKPPDVPPLAVQRYPADNAESAQAAAVAAEAPVVKEATVGVTVETGAYGSPLLADEDDEEIAKEMATFKRFVKQRTQAGKWRDFVFSSVSEHQAQELNRAGRVQVRKAAPAGPPVAAGLVVRAADTGRILMLQRALSPDDPNGGLWEFPGGCLELGETPLAAAMREWQEETGFLLPLLDLENAPSWTSDNGVYQGFVITVASEAAFDVTGWRASMNPDDPDGDTPEALCWMNPMLIPGNPSVRPEVLLAWPQTEAALMPLEIAKAAVDPELEKQHAGRIRQATAALYDDSKIRRVVADYLAAHK